MTAFDTTSAAFWNEQALDTEVRRVSDICNGCRRCVTLCPSFKDLFQNLDREEVDGEAERLVPADLKRVVDLCYQCKLSYNHCPYTPPHRWQVDFPRLMLRARAVHARKTGVSFQDRVLGNTALVGTLGSLTTPFSNWANELTVHRSFLQAIVGIHKARNLPRFHRGTFSRWFAAHRSPVTTPVGRVALFATCPVEYHNPEVGRATVRVLELNRIDVTVPPQRCCGMPYLDGGAVDEARAQIDDNVRTLSGVLREGREIVVPGPTCSYMLKQEYPWLASDKENAKLVAERTRDLFEYLTGLRAEGKLNVNFRRSPGKIAYHLPCHLKAQNLGTKSADLLRLIPGAQVEVIERCSGVDGTWGFKKEYYELSLKVAEPLFQGIVATSPDRVATDCPLAGLQIAKGTGREPRHPIQILAEAYGLEDH